MNNKILIFFLASIYLLLSCKEECKCSFEYSENVDILNVNKKGASIVNMIDASVSIKKNLSINVSDSILWNLNNMKEVIVKNRMSSDSLSYLYNKIVNSVCSYEKICRCHNGVPENTKKEACEFWITIQSDIYIDLLAKLNSFTEINLNKKEEVNNEKNIVKAKKMSKIKIVYANDARYMKYKDSVIYNQNGIFIVNVEFGLNQFVVFDSKKRILADIKKTITNDNMIFMCSNKDCICSKNCN